MHVVRVRKVENGKTYESALLRQSYREGQQVKKRTVASLTALPAEAIDAIERILRGEHLVAAAEALTVARSWPHGHVAAVQHGQEDRPGGHPRRTTQPAARPGAGDGGGAGAAARLQAGHHAAVEHHQPGPDAGGGGRHRGWAVRRPGLASRAPGADRAAAGLGLSAK